MKDIAEERGFRKNHSIFGGWGFNSSTDIAHVRVSEGLIYSVDGILDTCKIYYSTPEAIQIQLDKFNSEIRFIQDTGGDPWNLRRLEKQRDSFISYQRQLQGKSTSEPSLKELDEQKHIFEALDRKTTELLQQYSRIDQQKVETAGIDFSD